MLIEHTPFRHALIRIAVGALRLIAPLSIIYCPTVAVLTARGYLRFRWLIPVHLWMLSEALFFPCVYLPLKAKLQRDATHPEAPSREERQILFQRVEDNLCDANTYLSKWFLNAPLDAIRRENVKEFFAWSFMNKNYGDVSATENDELDSYTDRLEAKLSLPLRAGWGDVHGLRGTMEAVPAQHHPLLWYTIVGLIDSITTCRLYCHSFRFRRQSLTASITQLPPRLVPHLLSQETTEEQRLPYWYRKHTSKSKLPILFIHGIGIGLYAYVDFVVSLAHDSNTGTTEQDDGQVGIIALELLSISARICPPAIKSAEIKEAIAKILKTHGWDEFALVGHSYGTAISASMLRDAAYRPRIKALALLDPICFMLQLPDVAYNFTRRRPRKANEAVLYYFASQDLMTSHTIARNFFWSEYILWREDIPADVPTLITLGRKDLLVPVQDVWKHLTGGTPHTEGVESNVGSDAKTFRKDLMQVICFENFDHAALFASRGATKHVATEIKSLAAI